jgi:hypothetical protein
MTLQEYLSASLIVDDIFKVMKRIIINVIGVSTAKFILSSLISP